MGGCPSAWLTPLGLHMCSTQLGVRPELRVDPRHGGGDGCSTAPGERHSLDDPPTLPQQSSTELCVHLAPSNCMTAAVSCVIPGLDAAIAVSAPGQHEHRVQVFILIGLDASMNVLLYSIQDWLTCWRRNHQICLMQAQVVELSAVKLVRRPHSWARRCRTCRRRRAATRASPPLRRLRRRRTQSRLKEGRRCGGALTVCRRATSGPQVLLPSGHILRCCASCRCVCEAHCQVAGVSQCAR